MYIYDIVSERKETRLNALARAKPAKIELCEEVDACCRIPGHLYLRKKIHFFFALLIWDVVEYLVGEGHLVAERRTHVWRDFTHAAFAMHCELASHLLVPIVSRQIIPFYCKCATQWLTLGQSDSWFGIIIPNDTSRLR